MDKHNAASFKPACAMTVDGLLLIFLICRYLHCFEHCNMDQPTQPHALLKRISVFNIPLSAMSFHHLKNSMQLLMVFGVHDKSRTIPVNNNLNLVVINESVQPNVCFVINKPENHPNIEHYKTYHC